MKHKTAELEGALLDYAVAMANGMNVTAEHCGLSQSRKFVRVKLPEGDPSGLIFIDFSPSTDWGQGGPIIERERISFQAAESGGWYTYFDHPTERDATAAGPTALIAAMRAYVASKLGDEVELP